MPRNVDWGELMSRQRSYVDDERLSHSSWLQEQAHLEAGYDDDCNCFEESLWKRGSKVGAGSKKASCPAHGVNSHV